MVKEKGNELFFCRVAKMSARVAQISDCHLFTDPSAELRGVQPHRAVLQALQHVTEHETAFDYLVISGDLAHDEQRQTYQVLREMLGSWLPRCRLIPGNHDDRQFIHEVFAEIVPADTEAVCFEEDLATWRLMGLDSHVPGEVHGRLGLRMVLPEDFLRQGFFDNRLQAFLEKFRPDVRIEVHNLPHPFPGRGGNGTDDLELHLAT